VDIILDLNALSDTTRINYLVQMNLDIALNAQQWLILKVKINERGIV
jgi:hypothetical protein